MTVERDVLSAVDRRTFAAAGRKLTDACVNERVTRLQGRHVLRRLLTDKEALRRILTWLVDDSEKETQLAAADLLGVLGGEIKPALAALQPSQLVDVAAVVVDLVGRRRAGEGGSGYYGPDESLYVKHILEADAAVDVVTYVRLLLLASVLHALHDAAPDEGARLRDLFLASHQTTVKQCLTVMCTDVEGSVSRMAFSVLESLLLPFNPPPSSPEEDLTPIPLHLSLPLFSLLVDHLLKLAEGATHMDAQRWLMALELPFLVATAALQRQSTSLRVEDVKLLVAQHLYDNVELIVGIIASADGGMLAVAAATLGANINCALRLSHQLDFPTHLSLSSFQPLLLKPSLITTASRAANALADQDAELPPSLYPVMLSCLNSPSMLATGSGDTDAGHRVVEAVCQLLGEPVAPTLVGCIVDDLQSMIRWGHDLVTLGRATRNPFVNQIAQCEAVQQLRRRRGLSAEVLSFIDSLPKTANSDSSSATTKLSAPAKHKTTTHTHHASGPRSPPRPSTSSGRLDGLEDGLFSDDIDTFTAAVKDVAGCLRYGAVADPFLKRLAMRFAKERTAFRRFLMRLVDSSGVECQVAIADVLFCLLRRTPSDRVSAIEDIFEILTWKHLSSDGGVGGDLGGKVYSVIEYDIVRASSGDEPLPRAIDVVTCARLRFIRYALEAATALEAAGGPQLRASVLQTHQTTLRQAMDVIRERRHVLLANEAVMMLNKLFEPSPFGPSIQLVLEFVSIFVESLKQLGDDETEGTRLITLLLDNPICYLLNSPREGMMTAWPAIRAALNTHVYANMDMLVDRIAASDPSSPLGFAAIRTVGTLLQLALILCVRKRKGGGPLAPDRFEDAIEQNGVGKIMAAAPLPMQSLRRLLLDAAVRDKVANPLRMDYRTVMSSGPEVATALLTPAMAMIEDGNALSLVESGFMSTLISLLDSAERIRSMVVLCMCCLKSLIQKDRKVLGTDGLSKAMCDMLLKDAQGQLLLQGRFVFYDSDRKTAVDILKSIVSYGKSQVRKGAPNPIVGEILQLESVKAIRDPKNGIEVSRQVVEFFNSLDQQHQKDTQATTAMSAEHLAAQEAKAKRIEDALLKEERREKEAKEKKGKDKKNKGGKGQQQQQQQGLAGGDASPSDVVVEPSVPSTAASTSRVSAAEEVEASQPEPSPSIADTSGVPSVSAAAGSDRPGDGGDAVNSAADGSDGDGDDEDRDAMLVNSAFALYARQQRNEGKKKGETQHQAHRDANTLSQQPAIAPLTPTNNQDKSDGADGPPCTCRQSGPLSRRQRTHPDARSHVRCSVP
ncbi:unnamed protein product [Vitrella brassicaformis CCMP3155]|uniref:Uncharacterized protein n=1 Tax=Vitrella brassicaformis (strain CCMP3155) TaxID=1169540 RepID=A0A0G4EGW7_VITBC|nr:unnamed protein product [Vitrella brassicaformis CCMP3155]|eukprot:CEL95487.1 unnamed protein product [Vitrella brassicaformis CCMP3155]